MTNVTYKYVCIYVYTFIHLDIGAYIRVCIRVYVYIYIYIYLHLHMYYTPKFPFFAVASSNIKTSYRNMGIFMYIHLYMLSLLYYLYWVRSFLSLFPWYLPPTIPSCNSSYHRVSIYIITWLYAIRMHAYTFARALNHRYVCFHLCFFSIYA